MTKTLPQVDVIHYNTIYHLTGRLAAWVIFLCQHMEEINALRRGRAEVRFSETRNDWIIGKLIENQTGFEG